MLWRSVANCSGGGGKTVVYANGRVYARGLAGTSPNAIFDAGTGAPLGSFGASAAPAFGANAAFFLNANVETGLATLTAADALTNAPLWSFRGDDRLVTAPIVIDGVVVVGSATGNVYALDAATGAVLWTGDAGASIDGPDEQNAVQLTGLGAGEGYLVVPAGARVTAWRLVP